MPAVPAPALGTCQPGPGYGWSWQAGGLSIQTPVLVWRPWSRICVSTCQGKSNTDSLLRLGVECLFPNPSALLLSGVGCPLPRKLQPGPVPALLPQLERCPGKARLDDAWSKLGQRKVSLSWYGAGIASLGILSQPLTGLSVKNSFSIFHLSLPSGSRKPFPLVLSLQAFLQSLSPPFLHVYVSNYHSLQYYYQQSAQELIVRV